MPGGDLRLSWDPFLSLYSASLRSLLDQSTALLHILIVYHDSTLLWKSTLLFATSLLHTIDTRLYLAVEVTDAVFFSVRRPQRFWASPPRFP